jgi:PKD repeat protein
MKKAGIYLRFIIVMLTLLGFESRFMLCHAQVLTGVAVSITNVTCDADGQVFVNASNTNGIYPFTFKLTKVLTVDTLLATGSYYYFNSLTEGVYNLNVRSYENYVLDTTINITRNYPKLELIIDTIVPDNGTGIGSITLYTKGGYYSYFYSSIDGDVSHSDTFAFTGLYAGSFYYINASDSNYCNQSLSVLFPSNSDTTKGFQLNTNNICLPVNVESVITNNTSVIYNTTDYVHFWTINGNTYNFFQPKNIGLYPGHQDVNYMIRKASDNSLVFQQNAGFDLNKPTVRILGGTDVCVNEPVEFKLDNAGYGLYNVDWNLGDGTKSTDFQNVMHSYAIAGQYRVKVLMNYICPTDTFNAIINVGNTNKPKPEIITNMGIVYCQNDSIQFNVEGNFKSYNWDFGDLSVANITQNPTHSYLTLGMKSVILSVTNFCNQTGTDTLILTIGTNNPADASFNFKVDGGGDLMYGICPYSNIYFDANNIGVTYNWSFGDGSTANVKSPVHYYTREGIFEVTLTVVNGCGNIDVKKQTISIQKNYFPPSVHMGMDPYAFDTLHICPGTTVNFYASEDTYIENISYNNSALTFMWDFGDGEGTSSRSTSHTYTKPGVYTLQFNAMNGCGGSKGTEQRIIFVDNAIMPVAKVNVVPTGVCPGEQVYFYDDNFDSSKKYVYNFNFGDGASVSGITNQEGELYTLASHVYSAGVYNYTVQISNQCGNSITQTGTIKANTDTTRAPFYYVGNSTDQQYNGIEDWSSRKYPSDYKVTVPIRWLDWPVGRDNNFYVYFWYNKFDTTCWDTYSQPACKDPDSFVKIQSDAIIDGDSAIAYIPYNGVDSTFSLAFGYFCKSHNPNNQQPDEKTLPLGLDSLLLLELPIVPAGSANLGSDFYSGYLDMNGTYACNAESFYPFVGTYESIDKDVFLDFANPYEDSYEIYDNAAGDMKGYYSVSGNWTYFNVTNGLCSGLTDIYTYFFSGDTLILSAYSINCSSQSDKLNGKKFIPKKNDYDMPHYACPNEDVAFNVAGGSTWEWNFGDGAKSSIQNAKHKYISSGKYNAFVVINSSCGQTDTIYTPVVIADHSYINAYFVTSRNMYDMSEANSFTTGDSVYFKYYQYSDRDTAYALNWKVFHDNIVVLNSNKPVVGYQFLSSGTYKVRLMVSNACGDSAVQENEFNVVPKVFNDCFAGFTYKQDSNIVTFKALNPKAGIKFEWYISGYIFNNKEPVYAFENEQWLWAELMVSDSVAGCHQINSTYVSLVKAECLAMYTYSITGLTATFTNTSSNAYISEWDYGDGTTSTNLATIHSHVYSNEGWYWVRLKIKDNTGTCTNDYYQWIKVGNPDCYLYYNYYPTGDNCYQFNAYYSDTSYWTWDFGDGYYSSSQNPAHCYSSDGVYKIKITATRSDYGCTQTDSFNIIVNSIGCTPDFTDSINGNTVSFTNTSARGTQFWWDFGDYSSTDSVSPTHTYTNPGLYEVWLWLYDSVYQCSEWTMKRIMVGEVNCNASFSYQQVPGMPNTISFSDYSYNAAKWIWNFGDGTKSTEQNPLKNYTSSGVYNVCLTVMNAAGDCMQKVCMLVEAGEVSCLADFNFIIDSAKVTFNNLSSKATDFYWSFGDGNYDVVQNPVYNYSQSGLYNVCLSIYDSVTYCYSDICKEVKVIVANNEATFARFAYYVQDDTVFFTNYSENANKYYWTFGDGSFNATENPTKIYTKPGVYRVCLKAFNSVTGAVNEYCEFIEVGSITCLISANYTYIVNAEDLTIRFENKTIGNADVYYWDFGDGQTSDSLNPLHVYALPGYYLVSLASKKKGLPCGDIYAELIQVGATDCKAEFDYSIEGNTVSFIDNSKGATYYYWYYDDGGYSTIASPTHSFSPGLHYVWLTIADASGTCMDNTYEAIQVGNVECSAYFTYYVDITTKTAWCKNESVGDATLYYWTFGDGTMSTDTNPSHKFNYPGYYNIGLNTFNSANMCMDYYEAPVLIAGIGDDCETDFAYRINPTSRNVKFLDLSKGNITTYMWDFGDGATATIGDPQHTYTENGFYNVCLSIINDQGNPGMACKWVKVAATGAADCKAKFVFAVDSASKTAAFVDKSFGTPNYWEWDFGDGSKSSLQNPPIRNYANAGYYLVSLYIENTNGCKDKDYKLVNVSEEGGMLAAFGYDIDSTGTKASGYPVDFVGTGQGDHARLRWDFGDGGTNTTTVSPTHVYTESGTYKVCLSYEDPVTLESDSTCEMVIVGDDTYVNNIMYTNKFSCSPNPFGDFINITYALNSNEEADICIYDLLGKNVMTIKNVYQTQGDHTLRWDTSNLGSGSYIVQIKKTSGIMQQIVVIKQ